MGASFSLAGLLDEQARARPDHPALVAGSTRLSYVELDERAGRVASALAALGVGDGDRVAFLGFNSPEYFEVLFGCGKRNAVCVPVNWRLAPPEVAAVLDDCDARVVVVGPEFRALLDGRPATSVIGLGPDYEAWVRDAPGPPPVGRAPAPDDVAVQLYTSGTTGRPKGVMLANRNFQALFAAEPLWGMTPTSVNLVAMPVFHIGGTGWALVGIHAGATTVVLATPDPSAVLDAVVTQRVTHGFVVPAVIQGIVGHPRVAELDLSSLELVTYGASPIAESLLVEASAVLRCPLAQLYGMTETTGAFTQLDAADHDPGGPRAGLLRSCGRPFPWVELRIVDPDTGLDVATGVVGEIWTRSAQNMLGYWRQPEATAETITPDGWLRTGDAAYRDADGFVFLFDRLKDMIVSGGENVYPVEAENALSAHPGVADVAVIGVPDDRWGETVKACVVREAGVEATGAELIAWCRERLAHYKCPTSVDFVERIPRNASGKILKTEIREPYWRSVDRRVG